MLDNSEWLHEVTQLSNNDCTPYRDWSCGVPAVGGISMSTSSSRDCWGHTPGVGQSVVEAVKAGEEKNQLRTCTSGHSLRAIPKQQCTVHTCTRQT